MNNWPSGTSTHTALRCTVSPSALSSSLSLVSRAVSPRSTLPVLSNVLLETEAEGLRVTATNLDLHHGGGGANPDAPHHLGGAEDQPSRH